MAFQVKDFASIAASCVNYLKSVQTAITDFRIGAVARTLMEAFAAEAEELYQQMFVGLREAIPVAIYSSFNFPKLAAVPASGNVRVTIAAQATDLTIVAGTIFAPTALSLTYASQSNAVIPAGQTYADVYVVCTSTGSAGNLAPGTPFSMQPQPAGFVSAANTGQFLTGTDAETDAQQKARFISFIESLQRGTVGAVRYGLSLATISDANGVVTEQVIASNVVEPWISDNTQPVGYVQAYIHNGVNGASAALIAQASKILYGYYRTDGTAVPGYKAAGARVDIFAATVLNLNVTAVITVAAGNIASSVQASVQTAIQNYLTGLSVGQPALFATIIQLAMDTPGVANFALSSPAADTAASVSQKIMPGTMNLTTQ
ncbi:baseplate J/gp47 family protein [Burkholderia sp. Ac-20349]|uniref:baseplate J/gp47 family protein n=1 Tax=Burkholderia sp. Ac-20349 TaxID=2703893 RepID=UPI00197BD0E4|nr:baseplate J/gp47 family protein [Burkholderia sp. Ac-20349]MBN3839266.1 hypothetical protein [Burkholderia sp. Ac-20349]